MIAGHCNKVRGIVEITSEGVYFRALGQTLLQACACFPKGYHVVWLWSIAGNIVCVCVCGGGGGGGGGVCGCGGVGVWGCRG